MKPSTRPSVLPLSELAEAIQAGVVLALEERRAAELNGGALSPYPPTTMGMPVSLLLD